MRVDYYIYYRVQAGRAEELQLALASMQSALQAATGVAGRYRRRVDDPCTWMEIYEGVSDPRSFELELGTHALRHGLHEFLAPETARHMERFRAV
jgi:hypothetical protein